YPARAPAGAGARPRAAGGDAAGLELDGGARDGDHEHGTVPAHDLVVEVDADDRIGAEPAGLLFELPQRLVARVAQRPLVGAGAAADDVADAGEQVLEDVRADDHLADDEAEILGGGPALHGRRGGDDHPTLLLV